jgi:hypothetical protein
MQATRESVSYKLKEVDYLLVAVWNRVRRIGWNRWHIFGAGQVKDGFGRIAPEIGHNKLNKKFKGLYYESDCRGYTSCRLSLAGWASFCPVLEF